MSQTKSREMIKILPNSVFNTDPGLRTVANGHDIEIREPNDFPEGDDGRLIYLALSVICDACPMFAGRTCTPFFKRRAAGSHHVERVQTMQANNCGCHLHNIFVPQSELTALSRGERINDDAAYSQALPGNVDRRQCLGLLPSYKTDRP